VTGPDIPIMVDTNCGWTPAAATAAVAAMAPSKLFWVEEPIWPPEGFAALAAKERPAPLERLFAEVGFIAYAKPVPVVDGAIDVPDRPGLGADPEHELIERFRA
jgi:L-alanine-DL-glutamate epimerase-like enolase superfamily enzyme